MSKYEIITIIVSLISALGMVAHFTWDVVLNYKRSKHIKEQDQKILDLETKKQNEEKKWHEEQIDVEKKISTGINELKLSLEEAIDSLTNDSTITIDKKTHDRTILNESMDDKFDYSRKITIEVHHIKEKRTKKGSEKSKK